VPPPSSPRQTAATAQGGRRDMPLVWGVTRWKDLVLASDMNSGLWIIRVTLDGKGSTQGGSGAGGAGGSGRATPAPPATPPAQAAPEGDLTADRAGPGGWGAARWAALAGLALGLLAAGAVARGARRRRRAS